MQTLVDETERAADKAATKQEVASFFRVSQRTIDEWMRANRIAFWKIGRTVRFDLNKIKADLNAKAR